MALPMAVQRGLNVPAGKHQVELMFYPKSIDYTETIAYTGFVLLLVMVLLVVFLDWKKKRTP